MSSLLSEYITNFDCHSGNLKSKYDVFSDIDECARGKHDCSTDAVCNNTKGSYNCTCRAGYSGDGKICKGEN